VTLAINDFSSVANVEASLPKLKNPGVVLRNTQGKYFGQRNPGTRRFAQ
jgi:hypothetical protein